MTMSFGRRFVVFFALGLGLIGTIACIVAIFALWTFEAQLRRTTEAVFGKVDASLAVVQERAERARNRVNDSVITTEGMVSSLKEWTKREASQRVALRLNVAEKSDRLRVAILQADNWLEVSRSSAELAQQALSFSNTIGTQIETGFVDELVEEITSLRGRLAEATELVDKLHERAAAMGEESSQDRIEQAVQLALRVIATLGSMDSRLKKLENRLSETQQNLQGLNDKTRNWIRAVTIVITLLILWMAAGQVVLCWCAWTLRWHRK